MSQYCRCRDARGSCEETKPEDWDKRCRLEYLLDHWQDIFDVSIGSADPQGTERRPGNDYSKTPRPLPRMASDRSVKRVEYALNVLADREPVLVRHLKAYRCNAEWRTTDKWFARKLPSGKQEFAERRVREKIVPKWVDQRKVALAETLLLNFIHGDVSIPTVLYHALTKATMKCECSECSKQ